MTHQGEPICINEYATEIAKHENTHVMLLDDFLSEQISFLDLSHIDPNAEFQELVLDARPGR